MGAGIVFKLGIKSDFRETGVFHPCDLANPTILRCHQLASIPVKLQICSTSVFGTLIVLPLDMCNTA